MVFVRKLFFFILLGCFFHGLVRPMNFGGRERSSTLEAIRRLIRSFEVDKEFTLGEVIQQLPFIKKIKLPSEAKKLLDGMVFSSPQLKETRDSVEVTFENPLLFGQKKALTTRIYAGPGAKGKGFGFTFGIGIPDAFSYEDVFPAIKRAASQLYLPVLPPRLATQFKNIDQMIADAIELAGGVYFKNTALVLCVSGFFDDPVWGGLVLGINMITQMKLGGPLEKLTNFFGKDLTTTQFRGVITPMPHFVGSSISAKFLGTVPLLKFPGFELRTSTGTLSYGLEALAPAVVVPFLFGSTGIQIKMPGQKDFLTIKGFITVHTHQLDIGGQSVGMIENLFGIPGLDLGNLGVMLAINYAVAVATAEAIPIHGGAITGEVQIGSKKLRLLAKIVPVDFPGLPDIIFEGAAEGGLSRSDLIEFALTLASKASKMKGIKLDLLKLKNIFEKILPPFAIGDHKVLIVLRTTVIFEKLYLQGFHIKGYQNIAGLGGGFDISASLGGLKGKVYYDQIKIPKKRPIIIISGAGQDGIRGTKDDGPVGLVELSLKNQEALFDAQLSIPPLGIEESRSIDITPLGGIRFAVKHKLGGLYDSELHIEGKPDSLASFKVSGFLNLALLNTIRSFLVKKVDKIAKQANADLQKANERAQKEITSWLYKQVEDLDQQIVYLDEKIAAVKKACEEAKKKDKKGKSRTVCAQKNIQIAFLKSKKNMIKLRRNSKWDKSIARVARGASGVVSRATRATLQAARGFLQFAGKLIGGGFNISEIRFEGTLVDLIKKAKGMKAFIKGRIADKPFEREFQLNLKKVKRLPRQILRVLRQWLSAKAEFVPPHRMVNLYGKTLEQKI